MERHPLRDKRLESNHLAHPSATTLPLQIPYPWLPRLYHPPASRERVPLFLPAPYSVAPARAQARLFPWQKSYPL